MRASKRPENKIIEGFYDEALGLHEGYSVRFKESSELPVARVASCSSCQLLELPVARVASCASCAEWPGRNALLASGPRVWGSSPPPLFTSFVHTVRTHFVLTLFTIGAAQSKPFTLQVSYTHFYTHSTFRSLQDYICAVKTALCRAILGPSSSYCALVWQTL